MKDPKFLNEAAEQFLGIPKEDMAEAIDQTLSGHLRLEHLLTFRTPYFFFVHDLILVEFRISSHMT